MPVTDPAWRKGLQYLMSTQNPDGSWRVHTRMVSPAQVSPPYFETGIPFLATTSSSPPAGTSYAAMALLLALPKSAEPAAAPGLPELEPKGAQPWMRTALFGTAAELKSLLDRGLDVNSRTAGGTSLLMMAAPDTAKMKLLLDRGVEVNAKSKSGYTALMVASLYRGSGAAIRLLLAKGASAASGAGVMFNASPLMLATYAGEPVNVSLLHAKGADANRRMVLLGAFPMSPLALAISFGEVDTIKGADRGRRRPQGTRRGRDGLSLLHTWTVLANHTDAAQALIDAGVPGKWRRQTWLHAAALRLHCGLRGQPHGRPAAARRRRS